jgi:holo-[acyl-carrier protein] synthase
VIAGVGIDVVDCARFEALLADPGSEFAARTFTAAERNVAESRPSRTPAVHLAARYAAKEACVKALSAALAPSPLPSALAPLSEIEVLNDEENRPFLVLKGTVRATCESARVRVLHLSLSHDGPMAAAVVIAER